jgi:hypothetical protein
MNRYGRLAMSHWETYAPNQFRAIPDKEEFFTELGNEAAAQITERARGLAGADPPAEGYLEKVGRLNAARFTAREEVLRELILIEPETPEDESEIADPVGEAMWAIWKAGQEEDETEQG